MESASAGDNRQTDLPVTLQLRTEDAFVNWPLKNYVRMQKGRDFVSHRLLAPSVQGLQPSCCLYLTLMFSEGDTLEHTEISLRASLRELGSSVLFLADLEFRFASNPCSYDRGKFI